ncbi:ATP-dependent zinc metalloprotease FtsH [Myxococcaceae bacterium]|nr:ATP-dependent zinc metalloprotease FtsH [Myxococcaceae bacterium]
MDEFRGLYIKEEEIDALLNEETQTSPDLANPQLECLSKRLEVLQAGIAERNKIRLHEGRGSRLRQLADLFHLTPLEVDVVLVCLAPELDLKYEKLYAYLHDDVTKKRPSIGLALTLLCPTVEARLVARTHFAPEAPLLRHGLVTVYAEASERQPPLLAQFLKIDERIVHHLLGFGQTDARLLPFVRWREPGPAWQDMVFPEDEKTRLEQLMEWHRETGGPASRSEGLVLYFQGSPGRGKWTAADALCRKFGFRLLRIDVARLLHGDLSFETAARLVFREALLQQAALYFDGFDLLLAEDEKLRQSRQTLIEELEQLRGLVFLAGQAAYEPVAALHRKVFTRQEFPLPSYPLRKRLWETALDGQACAPLDPAPLAGKFRLSAGQIRDAVATARNLALRRGPANARIEMEDLHSACRVHSHHRLGTSARKIQPRRGWSDLVLPEEHLTQLREIANAVKYRHLVYGEWGFDRKLTLGKGLNILFSGPSGTGKTLSAEVLAGELGFDLYQIDLATVVSKYIGETEKNLDRIFREARDSNAILFFDEADALFGKRSEVKDAHDRYANIETAYLLQKMEEYEGIVILATNLRKNMDEAFVRRIHAALDFPFPEEEHRLLIWQGMFPSEAPLGADVDFALLARKFKLAGGHIKNIALHAAFLAAEEGVPIGMPQLTRAIKREYQKMGKILTDGEF